MKTKTIFYYIIIAILVIAIVLLGVNIYKAKTYEYQRPVVTMEVENYGTVKMELYPEYAPETVANFVKLVSNGYYDGLTFHRVIKDFMIQGGDKNGDGTGEVLLGDLKGELAGSDASSAYTIKGEFKNNGVNNPIVFEEGVLAMARGDYSSYSSDLLDESYNSAGSQFFIMTKRTPTLNGDYAAFGRVIEGMKVIEDISEVEVTVQKEESEAESATEESKPVKDVIIKQMSVDTFGVDYGFPETLEPFDYSSWLYSYYGIDPSSMVQ